MTQILMWKQKVYIPKIQSWIRPCLLGAMLNYVTDLVIEGCNSIERPGSPMVVLGKGFCVLLYGTAKCSVVEGI